MTGNKYQEKAHSYAMKGGDTLLYSLLGLIEETGELVDKIRIPGSTNFAVKVRSVLDEYVQASKSFGKVAKDIRKNWDDMNPLDQDSCKFSGGIKEGTDKELGDVSWMVANIAHHLNLKMDYILSQNLAKLRERKAKNVIIGNGDTTAERVANAGK